MNQLQNASMPDLRAHGSFVVKRSTFVALACILLSTVYVNAMFFKASGINDIFYVGIAAICVILFLQNTLRSTWIYMLAPFLIFADRDIIFGFLIFFALQKGGKPTDAFNRDKDVRYLLMAGAILLIFFFIRDGVTYHPSLGFVGRLEFGFVHPNLAPVWATLLAYYAKHYWSRRVYLLCLIVLAFVVLTAGSLGKVPILFFFLFNGLLFRLRRMVYYGLVLVIIVGSLLLLVSTTPEITFIVSGRNLIFQALIDVMGWKSAFLPVPQSELVNLVQLRSFFEGNFETEMPFDGIVPMTFAMGIVPSILFYYIIGLLRCPENKKDFDRRMIFWIFGFSANPITIWSPLFMFAFKAYWDQSDATNKQPSIQSQPCAASSVPPTDSAPYSPMR